MTLNTNKHAGDTIEPTEWNEAATAANKVTDQTLVAADVSDFDTEVSNNTDVTANTTHRTSDGSDHTFINQDVTTTGSPTFSQIKGKSATPFIAQTGAGVDMWYLQDQTGFVEYITQDTREHLFRYNSTSGNARFSIGQNEVKMFNVPLDMNSQNIINGGSATFSGLTVGGLSQFEDRVAEGGIKLTSGDNSSQEFGYSQIKLGYNGSETYAHYIATRHSVNSANNGILFYTSDGTENGVYPTNAVLGMVIDNGKVGIGTTAPSAKTHIQQDSASDGLFIDQNGNGIGLYIDNNGTDVPIRIDAGTNGTATSATAGANGDVPAQVVGYLVVNIDGTDRKIPYYAN